MATFDVNTQVRKVTATANGSNTDFDFAFQVNATSDIDVYVDNVLQTSGFSIVDSSDVAGLNTDGTGRVKFTTAPTNGKIVAIKSDVPLGRTSVYTAGGNITATSLETDFDTIAMKIGDADETLNRSVKAPVGDPDDIDMTLPAKASRVGTVLGFNATSGQPEAGPTIADVQTLAAITADIATLADIEDGTDATDAIQKVAAIDSNVTTVAANDSNVTAVAGKATEIGRLGTADAVSDMNTLGTAAIVSDMDTLADIATDIQTLADIEDGTDATDAIQTVAGISSDVTSVAAKASLITSDFVSDLNQVAVADVIADINTLATSDIVSDLNTLATSDFVADLNLMATSTNVADMNTVAGSITNVNNVSTNISSVNDFAARYRVSASAPTNSLDVGDLWFDSTNDIMKVYSSGGFINAGSAVNGTSERKDYVVGTASGTYTGSTTVFPATYDAGFVDVYQNGVKLQPADFTATNGTSVTLGTAAATGDSVSIVGYGTFELSNFSITDANDVPALGTAGQVLKVNSAANALEFGAGGLVWESKNSAFTAEAGKAYFVDTSSAAFTATLPASATIADEIRFLDVSGTFDTNNLTIGRNGHNIQGDGSDLTVSTERAGLGLIYYNATQGWLLKDK